jgi:hypothetical protein
MRFAVLPELKIEHVYDFLDLSCPRSESGIHRCETWSRLKTAGMTLQRMSISFETFIKCLLNNEVTEEMEQPAIR